MKSASCTWQILFGCDRIAISAKHLLIGRPKNARLVARVLSHAEYYGHFPCHRVVNHAGRIAPGWSEQADLLRAEGAAFKDETHVDLRQSLWLRAD